MGVTAIATIMAAAKTKVAEMRRKIKERLEKYHIHHSTLEVECEECKDCAIVEPVKGHPE